MRRRLQNLGTAAQTSYARFTGGKALEHISSFLPASGAEKAAHGNHEVTAVRVVGVSQNEKSVSAIGSCRINDPDNYFNTVFVVGHDAFVVGHDAKLQGRRIIFKKSTTIAPCRRFVHVQHHLQISTSHANKEGRDGGEGLYQCHRTLVRHREVSLRRPVLGMSHEHTGCVQ